MAFKEATRTLTRDSCMALIKLDISNAFNTVSRPAILAELAVRAPDMLPWVRASFQPAALYCGNATLWSHSGVQQGDPLGPLLFAAGLDRALRDLPEAPGLEAWYLPS